jgi:hypothetical protein
MENICELAITRLDGSITSYSRRVYLKKFPFASPKRFYELLDDFPGTEDLRFISVTVNGTERDIWSFPPKQENNLIRFVMATASEYGQVVARSATPNTSGSYQEVSPQGASGPSFVESPNKKQKVETEEALNYDELSLSKYSVFVKPAEADSNHKDSMRWRMGTIISPELFVTYLHGSHSKWQNGTTLDVVLASNHDMLFEATVFRVRSEFDYVLCRLSHGSFPSYPVVLYRLNLAEPIPCVAVGFSYSVNLKNEPPLLESVHGDLIRTAEKKGLTRMNFLLDNSVVPGYSGGGVFRRSDGALVGMVCGLRKSNTNVSFKNIKSEGGNPLSAEVRGALGGEGSVVVGLGNEISAVETSGGQVMQQVMQEQLDVECIAYGSDD